jgi:homoserine dehydrogenase
VGGGTPYLSFASKCLLGERILEIHGILNGTTNYILTRMDEASLTFQGALREAREKGYTEADPSNDVDGYDTAAKMVIIANWVMSKRTSLSDMEITGISRVTPQMLKKAKASDSKVKLIGRVSHSQATVRPEEVSSNDPVCVDDTLNALTFSTVRAGDITLVGHGAGGERTASAIIRDLVDIRNQFAI